MKGFQSPNHTQVPNDLFDSLMHDMDETELRVTMVAIRKTLGYHKFRDAISLTTFIQFTGLSRQGVLDGIDKAKARGTLSEVGKGKRGINIYELVLSDDQSNQLTSQSNGLELVNSVDQLPTVTSQPIRPSKETRKKTEKESAPSDAAIKTRAVNDLIQVFADVNKVAGNPYNKTGYRSSAEGLHDKGVTPDDLRAFLVEQKQGWAKNRAVNWTNIENNILTWKDNKPRNAAPAAPLAPVSAPDMTAKVIPMYDPIWRKENGYD